MPSHNISALALLAVSPSLVSAACCFASRLALLPLKQNKGSFKADPRATPSLISFLADSFFSKGTHGHHPLWSQKGYWPNSHEPPSLSRTTAWTRRHLLWVKKFGICQIRCPGLPGWTPGLARRFPCPGLSMDLALATTARPCGPAPRCWGHSSCCGCPHLPACPPSRSHRLSLCPGCSATSRT